MRKRNHVIERIARLFVDSFGFVRLWVIGVLLVALAVAMFAGFAALDRAACEQKAAARPSVPMEWHFPSGCLAIDPDQTVVVSQ